MKALLLVEDDALALAVEACLKPVSFECIRYRNPVKALDNLEEIAPDAIVASALDFPRHWKIIADVVRSARSRQDCVIILVRGEHFGADESDKAEHLGVNGVVSERLDDLGERTRFLRLLGRHSPLKEARADDRVVIGPWDKTVFLFSHPETTRILGGRITTLSVSGLSLEASDTEALAGLAAGMRIPGCSLRFGEKVASVDCSIARKAKDLAFTFTRMDDSVRRSLEEYLKKGPRREMQTETNGVLIF